MVLFWAMDALLVVWTFAFVTSDFFYEQFTQQPKPRATSYAEASKRWTGDESAQTAQDEKPAEAEPVGELPSLLARALEQVEDQTFAIPNTHRSWPDSLVSNNRN